MPGAVGVLFAVGSAVAGAAVAVASAIGGAVAGIASAIGGVVAGIATGIVKALGPLVSGIGSIVGDIGFTIGSTLQGLVDIAVGIIRLPFAAITGDLELAWAELAATIDFEATVLANILNSTIVKITLPVMQVVTLIRRQGFKRIKELVTMIDPAATAILTPIKESLVTVKGAVDAIKEPVETVAGSFQQLRETISDIASLKIVDEMLKDTADISDLLEPIANAKSVETATAIATLARSIVGTTVATMDKIDTEYELLGATIDTFDERIEASINERMELTKAEVLSMVTPKMETLGRHQGMVIKGIARISRHIEDESWFVAMFLRMLR